MSFRFEARYNDVSGERLRLGGPRRRSSLCFRFSKSGVARPEEYRMPPHMRFATSEQDGQLARLTHQSPARLYRKWRFCLPKVYRSSNVAWDRSPPRPPPSSGALPTQIREPRRCSGMKAKLSAAMLRGRSVAAHSRPAASDRRGITASPRSDSSH